MKQENLSLTVMLTNVSHLLIYKDNWNNSKVMRKVIAELLRTGRYETLFTGSKIDFQCSHYFLGFKNCAIISLKLSGSQFLSYDEKNTALIFAKELENLKNVLNFDNSMLSEINHVSYTDIGIRIAMAQEIPDADSNSDYSQIA
jgi:hypothetical protein